MASVEKISDDSEENRKRYLKELNRIISDSWGRYLDSIASFAIARGQFDQSVRIFVKNTVDKIVGEIEARIVTGIDDAFTMSTVKNQEIGRLLQDGYIAPANLRALEAFKSKELQLSSRIYKAFKPAQAAIEDGLAQSIAVGKPAAQAGRELRKFLKQPNRGVSPGQGVAVNPISNIERLTITVINDAYRTADHERWKSTPFILGFEVRISEAHPELDICDSMQGRYPVSFLFSGWHPRCLCYSIPVLMSNTQFSKYQKLVLSGEDTEANIRAIVEPVVFLPEGAKRWIEENKERISKLKTLPYWFRDNKKLVA